MNESFNIIPEKDCPGCGKCCESFEIAYPNPKEVTVNIAVWRSEIDRFKLLLGVGDYVTSRDDGDVTWLEFHFPCRHLKEDKSCAIYNDPNRPLLCQRFPYPNSTPISCPKVRL